MVLAAFARRWALSLRGGDLLARSVSKNLLESILRHCGADIGKCVDAPHRGSRLEPRGTDPAIVFGRYCR
jgi:hypothetical protein